MFHQFVFRLGAKLPLMKTHYAFPGGDLITSGKGIEAYCQSTSQLNLHLTKAQRARAESTPNKKFYPYRFSGSPREGGAGLRNPLLHTCDRQNTCVSSIRVSPRG